MGEPTARFLAAWPVRSILTRAARRRAQSEPAPAAPDSDGDDELGLQDGEGYDGEAAERVRLLASELAAALRLEEASEPAIELIDEGEGLLLGARWRQFGRHSFCASLSSRLRPLEAAALSLCLPGRRQRPAKAPPARLAPPGHAAVRSSSVAAARSLPGPAERRGKECCPARTAAGAASDSLRRLHPRDACGILGLCRVPHGTHGAVRGVEHVPLRSVTAH